MADEKIFIVPLRRGTQKAPMYRRSKKAVNVLREYVAKHMKTDQVRIGMSINLKIWERGIKNPPHKLKIVVTKNEEGVATAELFGAEIKKKPEAKNAKAKKADEKEAKKVKADAKEAKTKKADKPSKEE